MMGEAEKERAAFVAASLIVNLWRGFTEGAWNW